MRAQKDLHDAMMKLQKESKNMGNQINNLGEGGIKDQVGELDGRFKTLE